MSLLVPIIRHIHKIVTDEQGGIKNRHENKVKSWSERQDRPISDTTNTVKLIGDVQRPPSYVMETLKLAVSDIQTVETTARLCSSCKIIFSSL